MMRTILVSTVSLAVLAGCATEPPVEPTVVPMADREDMDDVIVVTGSRIQRTGLTSPSPVFNISPEQLGIMGTVDARYRGIPRATDDPAGERYDAGSANPVLSTLEAPVSTFSIDVDTSSYTVVRDYLEDGLLPPSEAVRPEELINYFDYQYPQPTGSDAPFAADVHVTPNPWNSDTELLHIGIQGADLIEAERPRVNLVYLIDVSGSMGARDKLPLAVEALRQLVAELDPDDSVAIVTYAGRAGTVLEPTLARESDRILEALDRLHSGGSTAGGAGLAAAYNLAERNFDEDAVNRVMLLTDGDFNVGVTNNERLEDFVARKRDTGIYLSVFGFGSGNYHDDRMQQIAQAGNGVAGYIDSPQEAHRLMVEQVASTLFTIAEDVKIQVEFNPALVAEYRLIGYETRALSREDFNNDSVDAGEIGAGHSVTAIYEISGPDTPGQRLDPLRYGAPELASLPFGDEYGLLRIRFKEPGGDESQLIERPMTRADRVQHLASAPQDVRFSICVAGFAQLLREDARVIEGFDYDTLATMLGDDVGDDRWGYRSGFRDMVHEARLIDGRQQMTGDKP
jgi:Ca-activated chloride channel family protein